MVTKPCYDTALGKPTKEGKTLCPANSQNLGKSRYWPWNKEKL